MKRPWLAAGLCLVVVGLGTVGVRHESRAELQRALASLRANLPPDSRFEYDRAYPRFFARGAGFENARFIHGSTTLSARLLTISNLRGYLSTGLSVSRIHAQDVRVSGDVTGRIDDLTIGKLLLPPVTREKHDVTALPPVSQIHFRHGELHGADIDKLSAGCHTHIGAATIDNYGHDDGNASSWGDVSVFCPAGSPASIALSNAVHRNVGALSASAKTLNNAGLHFAQLVAWIEARFNGEAIPFSQIQPTLWETKHSADMHGLALSLMSLHLTSESARSKQWKEGDVIHSDGETADIRVTDLPQPLARIFPQGVTVATLSQHAVSDTRTGGSTAGFILTTPGLFAYTTELEGSNFQAPDAKSPPTLSRMVISYEDQGGTITSLMERFAGQQNMSLDQLKSRMLLPLALMTQTAPGLSALPGFLQSPQGHRLTIALTPPRPITVDAPGIAALTAALRSDSAMRQTWLSPPVLTTSLH